MKNEFWKDVIGYEDRYQISNLGGVKSLGNDKSRKEKILKIHLGTQGYFVVKIRKDNKSKTKEVHQLVAETFLNHNPCGHKLVVDHINNNKLDNRVENLQIVTNRFNTCKTQGNYSSKYKGVYWGKNNKKWVSQIYINGKKEHLGLFLNEQEASQAYENRLMYIL
jgi:hypothetical protein